MNTDDLDKKIVETFEKRFSSVLPTDVIDLALIENINWKILLKNLEFNIKSTKILDEKFLWLKKIWSFLIILKYTYAS